ncbi:MULTISPECIES: zf-HC2 domain-containing protein [unclassified Streptomyces]|uniref:zf-HC2 domain-containing protein n=1 Tax=unclassified Streptomyces TaxID=2593676 RepID=UPI00224FCECD|nr:MULTISPECIES: zf-HC2 domain-containing protein [unclassified Streptomyces]WSP53735.1 zf-HC2 domain-containing protein [Streptomyces sp. NBC_01241]WSU25596.1 zf-HC2 domain-containing protein [Streptomyces sp. NBC_01108]MCX4785136.1 zf-HC2 domain-containing protein [Streptomyces sp. NBC_01221]MCX4798923.1 zf-HC2 domain-containing protein [Streptomyces sp. NBC_01242]WSJ40121.1 zf-HC2 domain-containing protein [Streptomyces sp. NBC_01321]
MIEAHCSTKMSGEKPVVEECRRIRGLLAKNALEFLAPDEASAVAAHLATCDTCRDERDRRAAVPAHLTLLRDALACGQGRNRRACAATRAERGHGSSRYPGSDGAAPTTQITLAQWVSKTTSQLR